MSGSLELRCCRTGRDDQIGRPTRGTWRGGRRPGANPGGAGLAGGRGGGPGGGRGGGGEGGRAGDGQGQTEAGRLGRGHGRRAAAGHGEGQEGPLRGPKPRKPGNRERTEFFRGYEAEISLISLGFGSNRTYNYTSTTGRPVKLY